MKPTTGRRSGGGELLLTAHELGHLIGLSADTVMRWEQAGKLPGACLRRPGCTRWSRTEIEAWIASACPDRKRWEQMRG